MLMLILMFMLMLMLVLMLMVMVMSMSMLMLIFMHMLKVTVQFERCFRLMEHISVISWRNPINLYITEKLIKLSKSLFNLYLVISDK